ncbi:MAG: hypothetical protein WBD22_03835 [Pyrinomonadaceae bacterium]
MKKLVYFKLLGGVIAGVGFMVRDKVSSQEIAAKSSDALAALRDRTLRTNDPQKVVAAIDEVTAPFRARPVTSTEPIPPEALSALVDLLDFERPNAKENIEFDLTSGTKMYPVMRSLIFMRNPVLPALVGVIENEDSQSVKSQNALRVVKRILENDNTKTFKFLQVQAGNARSEVGKERLLIAANSLLK